MLAEEGIVKYTLQLGLDGKIRKHDGIFRPRAETGRLTFWARGNTRVLEEVVLAATAQLELEGRA